MPNSIITAEASPSSAELEGEFNDWYLSTHILEVRAAVPEITGVSRYKIWEPVPGALARYIAVYKVEGLSAAETAAKLGAAAAGLSEGPMLNSGDNAPALKFADELAAN